MAGLACAAGVFVLLHFVTAPYGRHARTGWGPSIGSVSGWVLMETPAVAVFAAFFLSGHGCRPGWVWVFVALWEFHYVQRALVFPFRLREAGKRIPVLIVVFGIIFNVYNGYLNGRYLGVHGGAYGPAWFADPRFLAGAAAFAAGMAINLHSDHILRNLRQPGESGYRIPQGGLFRWVSCPNYFGETLAWAGWAVATWSLPGLFFAVWTAANLLPRARAHHRWYLAHFAEYPTARKAIVPYLY
ncbi:MAG: DUF1295 domain-containing protein [Candidatus Hydrogenedentes bacterium]|nr:DUF1295 domain-containing protein [Candidatus Hydrogenedentota bacterium]